MGINVYFGGVGGEFTEEGNFSSYKFSMVLLKISFGYGHVVVSPARGVYPFFSLYHEWVNKREQERMVV